MLVMYRILLAICVITSTCLKGFVEGELYTKDGGKIYSFKYPFVVEFYHKYNFNSCTVVGIGWHNPEWFASPTLNVAPSKDIFISDFKDGKFTYRAQILRDKSAVNSSMSAYVDGRNMSKLQYKVRVTLTCTSSSSDEITVPNNSISIALKDCSPNPRPQLHYGTGKKFNDSSKAYCADGAELYDGANKIMHNESYSKCGAFGEWLGNISCWFAPEVQLSPLQIKYHEGEVVLFYCNVSEGFPSGSSGQLWIGDQNWPTKNNYAMVELTEFHNNKAIYCSASNAAGTNYSNNNLTLTVYFAPILVNDTICLKPEGSNYSVQFTSNPQQNRTTVQFILQNSTSNFTNATIEGFWEEEKISRYGVRLQKFTAFMNVTVNSRIFIKFGNNSVQKLNITNCTINVETTTLSSSTNDDSVTSGTATTTRNSTPAGSGGKPALYAAVGGAIAGLLVIVLIATLVIRRKRKWHQAQEEHDDFEKVSNPVYGSSNDVSGLDSRQVCNNLVYDSTAGFSDNRFSREGTAATDNKKAPNRQVVEDQYAAVDLSKKIPRQNTKYP